MKTPELLRSGSASKVISALAVTMAWFGMSEMGSVHDSYFWSFQHELVTPGVGAVLGRALTIIPGLHRGWRSPLFTQCLGIGAAAYLTDFDMDTMSVGYRYVSDDPNWYIGSDRPDGVYALLVRNYLLGLAVPTVLSLAGKGFVRALERNERCTS